MTRVRKWVSDHPFLVIIAFNAVLWTATGFIAMSELGSISQ